MAKTFLFDSDFILKAQNIFSKIVHVRILG